MRTILELGGAAVCGALLLVLVGTVKQRRYAERMRSMLAGPPISRSERRRATREAMKIIGNVQRKGD